MDVWIQRMALGQRDLGFLEQLAVLKWIDAHWDASWRGQLAGVLDCCFIRLTRELSFLLKFLGSRNAALASSLTVIMLPVQITLNATFMECCTNYFERNVYGLLYLNEICRFFNSY